MGKLKLKSLMKKKTKEFAASKAAKTQKEKTDLKIQEKPEAARTVVKTGYAKKGTLIAALTPAVLGKEGKNVLGEKIPAKEVSEPRLVAGKHIRVEQGTHFIMDTDGIVSVKKDEKGTFYINGSLYRKGRCRVSISDDEMKAFLIVTPPVGGAAPIGYDDVREECRAKGIEFGLKEQVIRETVENAEKERVVFSDVLIAEGESPVNGRDGKIEYKVAFASGNTFKVLDDGSVDYKEHDLITNVDEGKLLAVVIKAQEDVKDGHTVKGDVIEARKGDDIELEIGNNIQASDEGDSIHYRSKIGGQLITDGKKISVEPLLLIKGDIGPKTGNVNFNGVVVINGNIQDSYLVIAKKNITVQGNIGSSTVKSDENIVVKNGVIGKNKGLVYAQGDVTVKFAENSDIRAGGNIYIHRAALNCRLTAGAKIISLKEKGQIVGGELRAKKGVDVKILGNESEHTMYIRVGTDFIVDMQLKELKMKLRKYDMTLKKIILLLDKFKKISQRPEDLPEKLKQTYNDARKKGTIVKIAIDNLKKKEQDLGLKLAEVFESEVIAREYLYRGVKIYFGNSLYEPEGTRTKIKIYYDKTFEKIEVGTP